MSLFNDLLDKISKKLQGSELYKIEISDKVSSVIGIKINPDQIFIKKGLLSFSVSPTIKSLILIKKNILLKELQSYNIKTIV